LGTLRRGALALVGFLAVLHVVANGLWLRADEGIQFTDAAYHYSQVIELRDGLFGDAEETARWASRDDRQRYGELWYHVAVAVSALTGPAAGRLLLGLSFLLWPALLIAGFRLGEELAPRDRALGGGVVGGAVVGLLPGLFNYTRVLVLDAPLAAAVAWAIVGLLGVLRAEDEGRSTRKAWLLAGAAACVALAIKANAAAFLVGPWLVAAWPGLRRRWVADRRSVLWVAGSGLAAAGLVGLWMVWSHRARALWTTARDATWPGKAFDYAAADNLSAWPGDWAAAAWGHSWEVAYFTILQTFSPPVLLVCVGSIVWFFARRRGCEEPLAHAQRLLVFAAWIVPAVGVTVFLRGLYDERYVLPALPLAAGVVACALTEVPKRAPRLVLIGGVLLGGALNFLWISFDVLPTTRPLACATVHGWADTDRVGRSLWLCGGYPDYHFMDRPSEPAWSNWPLSELENELFGLRDLRQRPLRAVFLDQLYGLFYRAHQRDLLRGDLFDADSMLLITHCADDAWMASMFGSVAAVEEVIAEADVVVLRYGSPTGGGPAILGRRCSVFWPQQDRFEPGGALELDDGTEVRWYLRR
jgi:hypothetical protein